MRVLLLHPNMPGQYKHLAQELAKDKNNEVVFLTKPKPHVNIPGVKKIEYKVSREPKPELHRYLINVERGIFAGQEVWRVCKKLKEEGFKPDIIAGHCGWGDGLFLKDIFPDTPLLSYMEFYYSGKGADLGFDPEEVITPDDLARVRVKNTVNLINLEACDWAISPTLWQYGLHHKAFHYKMSVLHDGIDTEAAKPGRVDKLNLPSGKSLTPKDEIVTYIARNFEPYRGFPTFMRAVELIHKRRPNAQVLVIGNDGVSYGKTLDGGKTYKQLMLEKVKIDPNRLHFLGSLPYNQMINVLQISSAHIYLTVPFVLSWSMMESMSVGCAMICSNTQPVLEVIKDGENGLLVDFFSPQDIADRVDEIFAHPTRMQHMRDAARQTILDHYALKDLLPLQLSLLRDLAVGNIPPPTAQIIANRHPKGALTESLPFVKNTLGGGA